MRPIVRNQRQNQCSTPSSPLQPLFDEHSLSTTNIYPPRCKVGLMHNAQTSREIKKANGTLKTTKIKISAATVDREENSP